jgi:hypothetical protein
MSGIFVSAENIPWSEIISFSILIVVFVLMLCWVRAKFGKATIYKVERLPESPFTPKR